ncbi:MAG: hypothetical protein FWD23_08685, partial [Oscillospiraceae bacterium]|nr:hypothetical protein [Oscillospiraceae bacterium]
MKRKFIIFGFVITAVVILFLATGGFVLGGETVGKYASFFGNRIIENVLLPEEYKSYKSAGLTPVYENLANKVFFNYGGNDYYFYFSYFENYRNYTVELVYPDIYNAENNEKTAVFQEKPRGYFILDNYIYYAYG